jgi:putative SOS response-associated peptidase YedK
METHCDTATGKQPYCFEVNDGALFAFAGLWDGWKNAEAEWIKTCSVVTTVPNTLTALVHDRMPVILDRDSYAVWLNPGLHNVAAISELLKPFDAGLMRCHPVKQSCQPRRQ